MFQVDPGVTGSILGTQGFEKKMLAFVKINCKICNVEAYKLERILIYSLKEKLNKPV